MEPAIEEPIVDQQAAPTPEPAQPGVIPAEGLAALREQIRTGQSAFNDQGPTPPQPPKPEPTAEEAAAATAAAAAEAANKAPTPDLFISKLEELSGGAIKTPEELAAALTERTALVSQKAQFDETARLRELLDDPDKLVAYSRLQKTDFQDREKVSDKDVLKMAFMLDNSDLDADTAEGAFERQYNAKYPALKPEFADESDPDYKVDLGLRKRDSDLARTAMETHKEEQRLKFSAPEAAADKPDAAAIQKATEKHLDTVKTSLTDFNQYGVKFGKDGAQIFNYEVKPELKAQLEDFMVAPYQAIQKLVTPQGADGPIDYEAMRKIGLAILGFDGAVAAAATAAFNKSESAVIRELGNSQPAAAAPAAASGTVDDRAGFLGAARSAAPVQYNAKL